jgi:hypothetical protein
MVAAFILIDLDRIQGFLRSLVPERYQATTTASTSASIAACRASSAASCSSASSTAS